MIRFLSIMWATFVAMVSAASAQETEIKMFDAGVQFQLSIGSDPIDGISQPLTFMQVDPGLPTESPALIRVPRVVNDLQLIDSQMAEIRERSAQAVKKFQRRREELAKKYGDKVQEAPEEFAKETEKINEAQKKELMDIVESVLLPFQRTRLEQIKAQAKLNAHGSNALGSDEFAEALNLTEEQKKKLAEEAEKLEQKLREEIRELRRKRMREMLDGILNNEQEKKLDEMLGDELKEEKPKSDGEKK